MIAHNHPNFKRTACNSATLTLTTTLILNELLAAAQRLRTSTSPILRKLLAEALVPSGTLRERYRSPNLFLNFYHNQFSNLSSSILNKSESLETRIKSRTIAVAAIKMSASWIGVPLTFNLA